MRSMMQKIKDALPTILMYPLLILGALVFLPLLLLIFVPIDYIRYRRSAFYRDTHHKYEMFIGKTMWVRLYEAMRRDNLPPGFSPSFHG